MVSCHLDPRFVSFVDGENGSLNEPTTLASCTATDPVFTRFTLFPCECSGATGYACGGSSKTITMWWFSSAGSNQIQTDPGMRIDFKKFPTTYFHISQNSPPLTTWSSPDSSRPSAYQQNIVTQCVATQFDCCLAPRYTLAFYLQRIQVANVHHFGFITHQSSDEMACGEILVSQILTGSGSQII